MKTVIRHNIDIDFQVPTMPNFLIPVDSKLEHLKMHIKDLDHGQAVVVAAAMGKEFMGHWASFQTKAKS